MPVIQLATEKTTKMTVICQFNLSRSSPVYYTGEQISGQLTLTVKKKPLQLEAIKITLFGTTAIKWTESTTVLPKVEHNDSTVHMEPAKLDYTATKIHINETHQLTGPLMLLPGSTELGKFEFQLPNSLPATCKLPHGNVNYILQVNLERRGKHLKSYQQRLIIKKCIELADLQPQMKTGSTFTLSLPRSVFVPGQSVAYKLQSCIDHTHLVRLCQCIAYHSHTPRAKIKRVVRVLALSEALEDELHLPLTSPIMSDEHANEPIQIRYHIEAYNEQKECITLPLHVGTVAPPSVDANCLHGQQNVEEAQTFCFVNFASTTLTPSELFPSIQRPLPHSCSKEIGILHYNKQWERMKLLQFQKK